MTFAVIATTVIGAVALATDGGLLYQQKQSTQSAADAAALAGALSIGEGKSATLATAAATYAASQNGFVDGANGATVSAATQTSAQAGLTNSTTVTATVARVQSLHLAGVVGLTSSSVSSTATAGVVSAGYACAAALGTGNPTNAFYMGGNSTVTGKGCSLASNSTSSTAFVVNGSASVSAVSLVSPGGCSGCSGLPFVNSPLATTDPYASAQNVAMPSTLSTSTCVNINAKNGGTYTPFNSSTNSHGYCGLSMTNGSGTVNLTPGTYFFVGNVKIDGGTLQCTTCVGGEGVTIVLTNPGSGNTPNLEINGNATINLPAPRLTDLAYDPAFRGIVFYQTPSGQPGTVTLNGNANVDLQGAFYLPSASITMNGSLNSNDTDHCDPIVGNTIDTSGNSTTVLDLAGCQNYGTNVAQLQTLRLLQ